MGALSNVQTALNNSFANPMHFGPFVLPPPDTVPNMIRADIAKNAGSGRAAAAPQAAQGLGAAGRLGGAPGANPGAAPGSKLLT